MLRSNENKSYMKVDKNCNSSSRLIGYSHRLSWVLVKESNLRPTIPMQRFNKRTYKPTFILLNVSDCTIVCLLSKAGEATQSNIPAGGKLSDARRKQLGDTFRPQRPDPPFGVGNRRVNEDSPKIIFGQVTKITENSPKKQPGSPVMDPANIKLPKRRSSHKPEVSSTSQELQMKSPGTPLDTEGSRVAALRQRLLDMQNMQGKESKRVSILISKSEGNVAKKTRSLEDKVMNINPFCGKYCSLYEFVPANRGKAS